jgi:hypothetical protein
MNRALALCVVLSSTAFASSQGDWFASLYSGDGVELRNDERVFALFAVFNALGFDQGPVTRKEPVQKVTYHPVRQQLRARVIGGDPEVRKVADAFFDAHPAALRKYLAWVVQGDAPPFAAGAKTRDAAELKGFEQVLAKAWTGWKLEEAMQSVQGEYRRALKGYLPVIDGPLAKARATLKTPDTVEALLVVNLLDAQNEVRGVTSESGNQVFLIVGPSDKPNVEGLVREFARQSIEPQVNKQIARWAGGAQVLREAQLAGANEQSVAEYATAVLTTAVALRAMDANDAAWENAQARYFGIKDVAKLFDEGKPLEGWILDAMRQVETRRPAKK